MSSAVLDTSAVLALLEEEPGHDIVQELLFDAAISTVSLAEIYTKLATRGRDGDEAFEEILFSLEEIVPFTAAHAKLTGELRSSSIGRHLSLGDLACIALGIDLGLPVYTADRIWATTQFPCPIHLIR